eukprot:COSAG01_NODE_13895_length_1520_cov_2.705137_1_plen_38_part_01
MLGLDLAWLRVADIRHATLHKHRQRSRRLHKVIKQECD